MNYESSNRSIIGIWIAFILLCLITKCAYDSIEQDGVVIQTNITCVKDCNDLATLSSAPTGGTPPYTYSYSCDNGVTGTTQSITFNVGNETGTIDCDLIITDANGCTVQDDYTINITGHPNCSQTQLVDFSPPACLLIKLGTCGGGGAFPCCGYVYEESCTGPNGPWSFYATGVTFIFGQTGCWYRVNHDACGDCCISNVIGPLSGCGSCVGGIAQNVNGCNWTLIMPSTCSSGSWTLQESGNTIQSGSFFGGSKTVTIPYSGSWTFTATCGNSCVYDITRTFNNCGAPPCTLGASIVQNPACTLTALPSGGTAPYTYNWSNSSTASSITVNSNQNWFVTITDSNNCSSVGFATTTQCSCNCSPFVSFDSCEIDYSSGSSCSGYTYQLQFSSTGTGWSAVASGNTPVNSTYTNPQEGFYRLVIIGNGPCNGTVSNTVELRYECEFEIDINPEFGQYVALYLNSIRYKVCGGGYATANNFWGATSMPPSCGGCNGCSCSEYALLENNTNCPDNIGLPSPNCTVVSLAEFLTEANSCGQAICPNFSMTYNSGIFSFVGQQNCIEGIRMSFRYRDMPAPPNCTLGANGSFNYEAECCDCTLTEI